MSLWEDYQKNRETDALVSEVTSSMRPAMYAWLYEVARQRLADPYGVAVEIKNRFRIEAGIPRTRPNNYLDAPSEYRFTQFLLDISALDSHLFFTILDFLIQTYSIDDQRTDNLEKILDDAGHQFSVQEVNGKRFIAERLPDHQKALINHVLEGKSVYASEFYDSFMEYYGTNPDYTASAGEAFQSLESALKFYLGEDKGQNLGAILSWLRENRQKWKYLVPSDGQDDAEEQFIAQINFVNRSFRKTKHGQADKKLTVAKEHAGVILRSVALIIFELETVVTIDRPSS